MTPIRSVTFEIPLRSGFSVSGGGIDPMIKWPYPIICRRSQSVAPILQAGPTKRRHFERGKWLLLNNASPNLNLTTPPIDDDDAPGHPSPQQSWRAS